MPRVEGGTRYKPTFGCWPKDENLRLEMQDAADDAIGQLVESLAGDENLRTLLTNYKKARDSQTPNGVAYAQAERSLFDYLVILIKQLLKKNEYLADDYSDLPLKVESRVFSDGQLAFDFKFILEAENLSYEQRRTFVNYVLDIIRPALAQLLGVDEGGSLSRHDVLSFIILAPSPA